MWTDQDKHLLRTKWLKILRRWKRLNLDTVIQSYGFLLLVGFFWFLSYSVVARLCNNIYHTDIVGPIILERIISFGFFAVMLIVTIGHILTAYSSLFRGHELPTLIVSPYSLERVYRIQSFETLVLGGWVSGLFCIPILVAYGIELDARWWFFPITLLGLIGFLVLCGSFGMIFMVVTARWVIGRPLRSAICSLVLLTLFVSLVFYTALANRELFSNIEVAKLGEKLANLRLSSNPYLPSHWMAELMSASRSSNIQSILLYITLLWINALFFWNIAMELGSRWYADGWLWAQERISLFQKRREIRFRKKKLLFPKLLPRRIGMIVYKEARVFARDFAQWSQLVLILALILFYVAHTQNLTFEESQLRAKNQLAFFNVILLGFIQATLALRYTFPSISLESRAFWAVKKSSVGIHRFFFTKYYLHALVLLLIGEGMGLLLNHVLGIDPALSQVCAFVLFLFAFGFTSWTMGLGAVFHKFEATNAAEVTSDAGALVTIIFTLLYFGISIAFLARFALDYTPGTDIIGEFALQPDLILLATVFLLIQTCVILLPVIYGIKKLDQAII